VPFEAARFTSQLERASLELDDGGDKCVSIEGAPSQGVLTEDRTLGPFPYASLFDSFGCVSWNERARPEL
jgi:hypothetical protein